MVRVNEANRNMAKNVLMPVVLKVVLRGAGLSVSITKAVIQMRASLGGTESAGLCHLQYQYKKIQLTKNVAPSRAVTDYFYLLFNSGVYNERMK